MTIRYLYLIMRICYYILCISVLTVLISCKSRNTKKIDAQNIQLETYLEVGSYGGFTGESTSVFLLRDGRNFEQSQKNGPLTPRKNVSKKEAAALFEQAGKIKWDELPAQDFGNMNYFIKFHQPHKTYKIVWGYKGPEPPVEIKPLHNALNNLLHPPG